MGRGMPARSSTSNLRRSMLGVALRSETIMPMEERGRDKSSGIGSWEHALMVVLISEYGADGLGTATKLNKQLLSLTKAKPHEDDLFAARD